MLPEPNCEYWYELKNGSTLKMLIAVGWCNGCSKIRLLEDITDLNSHLIRIEEIKKIIEETVHDQIEVNKYYSKMLAVMEDLTYVVRNRVQPAKCTFCGSTDIEPYSVRADIGFFKDVVFINKSHDCGGELYAVSTIPERKYKEKFRYFYTKEGILKGVNCILPRKREKHV
ncbi:MAG: hypothetical protein ACXQTE_02115 [Methanosarcinaceae archaeon]